MKGQTVLPGDSSEISEENNEEDSVKELTWQPTIVIGIGGTGKEVVLNIKEQLERLPEVPPVLSFVVIDTAAAKSQELEPQEWHHITVDGSIVVRNLPMYPSIEKWWIKGLRAGRIDRGAGQKRIRGRLALFYPENFNEIADAIENALSNVMSVDKTRYHNIADTGQVVVNIVGSLCGGTGAGIFLDIAYLCRHFIGDGAISLIGTFGMPSMFSGISLGKLPNQYKRIRANCYSALTELEHFTTQARWRVTYPTLGDLDIDSPPYDVLYLVSGTNEENREFATQADAYRMISERILTETTSSLGIEFEEFFVNLDVLDGFIEIGGDKKPTAFSSYAVASLVIPRNSIRDHCSYQLAKEIIDLGLLKGCDDAEVDVTISTFTGTSTIDWASLIKYMREEDQSISSQFIALTCSQEDLTEGVDTEDIPARARQQLDLLASEGSKEKLNFGRSIKSAVEGLLKLRLQQLQDQVDTIIRNNGVRFAQTFLKLINEDLVDFKKTLSDQKYSDEIRETEKECKADIENMTEIAERTFTRSKSKRDDISQEVGEFVESYYRLLNANLGSYAKNHLTESFYNPLMEFINNAMPVFRKCVKSLEGIGTLLRSANKRNLAIVSAESEGYSLDRSVMDTSDIENIYSENIGHISTHVTGFIQEFGLPIEWDKEVKQYTSWHTEKQEDVANSRFLSYCSQFANSTCAKYDIFSVLGSNPDQIGGKIEWLLDVSKPFCQYVGGTRGNADFEQVHIIAVPEAAYNSDQFKETIDTIRQKSEDKNKYTENSGMHH